MTDAFADAETEEIEVTDGFNKWWNSLAEWHALKGRQREYPSTVDHLRDLWDRATAAERERCATVATDFAKGFDALQEAEGATWCPKCGEYRKNLADDIADSIRKGDR